MSGSEDRVNGEDKIRMLARFTVGEILLAVVLFGAFWFPFATGELKQYSVGYQTGAAENQFFPQEIRQLLYGKGRNIYRILFTITEDTVFVLHIRHGAQDTLKPDLP